MEFEMVKFDVTEAEIAKLKAEYLPLKIDGIKDVAGYMLVHQARMTVVKMRTTITKAGKAWRDQINAGIKKEQAEEKRLLAMLEPIETSLNAQESAIDNEKARIKADAEAKERARIQSRINRLFALGCRFDGFKYFYQDVVISGNLIPDMTDQDFENKCTVIQGLIDQEIAEQEEALRKHQEEEKRQAEERERLAAIAAEQAKKESEMKVEADRIAKIQADKEATIAREQAKLEAEKRKIEEEKRIEQARKEAAEKARIETEARLKREAEEKERRAKIEVEEKRQAEERAKAEAARQEALRPDKEKLLEYAKKIYNLEGPELKTEVACQVCNNAERMMEAVVEFIKTEVKKL